MVGDQRGADIRSAGIHCATLLPGKAAIIRGLVVMGRILALFKTDC
jgi:hypothetical protein